MVKVIPDIYGFVVEGFIIRIQACLWAFLVMGLHAKAHKQACFLLQTLPLNVHA
jgi:hypothetical protein